MRSKKRKRFKTIIIGRKSLFAYFSLFLLLIVCVCLLFAASGTNNNIKLEIARTSFENTLPVSKNDSGKKILYDIFCNIIGFDVKKPETIIFSQIKSFEKNHDDYDKNENQTNALEESNTESYPIAETSSIIGSVKLEDENNLVYINNETSFEINTDEFLNAQPSIEKTDGPLVLIVHTHTTESYTPSGQDSYTSGESTRTLDKNYNVVRVGEQIHNELENAGIKSIHDEEVNDYPSYNGSYKKTLGVIENYLEKYPSIQVVLDIHRDGMTKPDGTKIKLCADINGEKCAQVMILCGSSEGGLEHPSWRENLKLAMQFQKEIVKNYPGLARPLHLVKERYNQHATKGSMIIEVGTDGNTLEEAVAAGKYTGKAIANVLKKYN